MIVILLTVPIGLVTCLFVFNIIGLDSNRGGSVSSAASAEQPDTVTVYGQGKVTASPDIVYITLGYDRLKNPLTSS